VRQASQNLTRAAACASDSGRSERTALSRFHLLQLAEKLRPFLAWPSSSNSAWSLVAQPWTSAGADFAIAVAIFSRASSASPDFRVPRRRFDELERGWVGPRWPGRRANTWIVGALRSRQQVAVGLHFSCAGWLPRSGGARNRRSARKRCVSSVWCEHVEQRGSAGVSGQSARTGRRCRARGFFLAWRDGRLHGVEPFGVPATPRTRSRAHLAGSRLKAGRRAACPHRRPCPESARRRIRARPGPRRFRRRTWLWQAGRSTRRGRQRRRFRPRP